MIQEKILGGKHIIELEIAIEMIRLITGFKAFHSAISKTIIGVQEANSSYSIDEISLPTTSTQKWVYKRLEARDSRMVVSKQFDYSKTSKNTL